MVTKMLSKIMLKDRKCESKQRCRSTCPYVEKKESDGRGEQINGLVHEKANRQKSKAKKTDIQYFKSMQGHQTLLQSPICVYI